MTKEEMMLVSVDKALETLAVEQLENTQTPKDGWDQRLQCRAIAKAAKILFGVTDEKALGRFLELLRSHGFGGNEAQFQQWAEKAPPKGGGFLTAKPKKPSAETLTKELESL